MHPDTQYMMVKQRIADDHRQAELERLVRRARDDQRARRVHTVTLLARITRLMGRARRPRIAFPLATLTVVGLTMLPMSGVGAADPASVPADTRPRAVLADPTFAQRRVFLMEEHGYDTDSPARPVLVDGHDEVATPASRTQFVAH